MQASTLTTFKPQPINPAANRNLSELQQRLPEGANSENLQYFQMASAWGVTQDSSDLSEGTSVNKVLVSAPFKSLAQVNLLKRNQAIFKDLVHAIQSNNINKITAAVVAFSSENLAATLAKLKAIHRIKPGLGESRVTYYLHDLFQAFSFICEHFGEYEGAAYNLRQAALNSDDLVLADQLFEKSIVLYAKIKNPEINKVKQEQLVKCGNFKYIFFKTDTINPDLIKYKLIDRTSKKVYLQYKLKDGTSYVNVTEPYLAKEGSAEVHAAGYNILGMDLSRILIQRKNSDSKLALASQGNFHEIFFAQLALHHANNLYCRIKQSEYAHNLNFPIKNHKGLLQRKVSGIQLTDLLAMKPAARAKFMQEQHIPVTAIAQFQNALKFLNHELNFRHIDANINNIMLDIENKCFTLVDFSLADCKYTLAGEPANYFLFSPAELGLDSVNGAL